MSTGLLRQENGCSTISILFRNRFKQQNGSCQKAMPLTWIEQQLSESGLTIAQLFKSENQRQAADQLSISNSLGSLRFLGSTDWRQFVETMSAVEQTLQQDPAGIYGLMDFATRDRYRHAVEDVAKKSRVSWQPFIPRTGTLHPIYSQRRPGYLLPAP